ncbi:hypothetical protein C4573_00160 [Candidatus Woesearchaeota archaeon]|nr:MAG: hypothetical protein C4573_00160 [Candidatus Woesearchaeota archaeon]
MNALKRVLLGFWLILLVLPLTSGLTLNTHNLILGETLEINITDQTNNRITISNGEDIYVYQGSPEIIKFVPKKTGDYKIAMSDALTNAAIEQEEFTVSSAPLQPEVILFDKPAYTSGDKVIISFNSDQEELKVTISSSTDFYQFLGTVHESIEFVPNKADVYTVNAYAQDQVIGTATFYVATKTKHTTETIIDYSALSDKDLERQLRDFFPAVTFKGVLKNEQGAFPTFDLTIASDDAKAQATLKGVKDINQLTQIDIIKEANADKSQYNIVGDIVAVNAIALESATIQLSKEGAVTGVLECDDFIFGTNKCKNWQVSSTPFIDYGTYVIFTVHHFSAYTIWYNFTTNLTNRAYKGADITNPPHANPSSWFNASTALTSAEYTAINISDDNRANVSYFTNGTGWNIHMFEFKINQSASLINSIMLYWEGYGSKNNETDANNNISMFLYNFSQNNWTANLNTSCLAGACNSTTSEKNISYNLTTSISDFINSSGYLRFIITEYDNVTAASEGGAVCGNGVVEGTEECDYTSTDCASPSAQKCSTGATCPDPPACSGRGLYLQCQTDCTYYCGSCIAICPFIYSWDGSQYFYDNVILQQIETKEKETLQIKPFNFPLLVNDSYIVQIREYKPETSYFDTFYVIINDSYENETTTTEIKPASETYNIAALLYEDGEYLKIEYGEIVPIVFRPIPPLKQGYKREVFFAAKGYYEFYNDLDKQYYDLRNGICYLPSQKEKIQVVSTTCGPPPEEVRTEITVHNTLYTDQAKVFVAYNNSPPTHSTPVITPTDPLTEENFTCYNQSTSDIDGNTVSNIYAWTVNGAPLMLLYLPLDSNVTNTTTGAVKDYSTLNNNGTLGPNTETPLWNSSGIIRGDYYFDGGDYINISDQSYFSPNETRNMTISAWINIPSGASASTSGGCGGTGRYFLTKAGASNWEWGFENDNNNLLCFCLWRASDGATYGCGSSSRTMNDATWHMYTATINYGSYMTLYVDGVNTTTVSSFTNSMSNGNFPIQIGKRGDGNYFIGSVDDIRIYNRSLTPNQVKQMYNETALGKTDNSTITDLETITGENWTCFVTPNDGYEDGLTKNTSVVITATNTAPSVSTPYILPITPTASTTTLNCSVIPTDAEQTSLTLNFSWYNGTTVYNSTQYTVANNSNFTMNVSVVLRALEVWNCTVFANDGTDSGNSNSTTVTVVNAEPTQDTPTILPASPDALTNFTCYNQSTTDADGHTVTNIYNWLVNNVSITVLHLPFDTNVTSTATGAVKDYSGYNNNATLEGGTETPTYTTNGKIGGAYNFSSDHINVTDHASIDTTTAFTVELWAYPSTTAAGSYDIIGKYAWVAGQGLYQVRQSGTSLVVYVINGASTNTVTATSFFTANTWHHIAISFNSSNVTIYKNGTWAANTDPTLAFLQTNTPLIIGARADTASANYFSGVLDNIRIYNRSLTGNQIAALYAATSAGKTDNSTITDLETNSSENWTCLVTPNDGAVDGIMKNTSVLLQEAAADECAPSGAWNVTSLISCSDTTISVTSINISTAGYLNLTRVNLTTGITEVFGNFTSRDSPTTIWQNGNLTIYGIYGLDNTTLRMNGTTDGMYGIVVNDSASMTINNSANITRGSTSTFNYFFKVNTGSTFVMKNSILEYAGWSSTINQRGLEINTTVTQFHNNTILNNFYGAAFYANNSMIRDNNITRNVIGMYLDYSHNNSIVSNNLSGNSNSGATLYLAYGLFLNSANANTITNNDLSNIRTSVGALPSPAYGIYMINSENNTVSQGTFNNITGLQDASSDVASYAIYLATSNNNNFSANKIWQGHIGYYLDGSNSTVIDGTSIANTTFEAIYLRNTKNSIIRNIVMENASYAGDSTTTPGAAGVYLQGSSSNNITNITIRKNILGMRFGSYGTSYSNTNRVMNSTIFNNTKGIYAEFGNANYFIDSVVNFSAQDDIYFKNGTSTAPANITFINVTHRKGNITFNTTNCQNAATPFCQLNVYWYLNVQVNESATGINQALDQATVTATNVSGIQTFSTLTNSTGWITRQNVSEYWQNATLASYQTNYTINATKTFYKKNSTALNITSSTIMYLSLQRDTPYITQLNITPTRAYNNDTLNCSVTAVHDTLTNLNISITWYNLSGGSYVYYNNTNISTTNNTQVSWLLDSSVTWKGETWNCTVIANDGTWNSTRNSTTQYIYNLEPQHTTPIILPASVNNDTNFTCINQSTIDLDSSSVVNIYNWLVNGTPIMVLNMPFETNTSSSASGAIKDYSGYDNNGTLSSSTGPTWIAGKIGGAYDFDGADDSMSIPNSISLNSTKNITIAFWIKPKTFTEPNPYILYKGASDLNAVEYLVRFSSSKMVFIFYNQSGFSTVQVASTSTLATNTFYFVAATYNGSNLSIYINGTLQNSTLSNVTIRTNANTIDVGYISTVCADTCYANMTLDELKIFNRSLTANQIWQMYLEGNNSIGNSTITDLETNTGDNWTCEVIPNDQEDDGTTKDVSVIIAASNIAPSVSAITINSTDGTNVTTQDLHCNATITDPEGTALNVSVQWYKNGVVNYSQDYNNSYSNGTMFNATLGSGNTTKGDIWFCSFRASDGSLTSDWINSSNLTILNSNPIMITSRINPSPTALDSDTLSGYCNATDADNDSVVYYWQWWKNSVLDSSGNGNFSTSLCYQETATTSTACGGLSTGTYLCSGDWDGTQTCALVYDGSWATYGTATSNDPGATLYINYTKPTNAISTSLWEIKDNSAQTNLSMSASCWSQSILQLSAGVGSSIHQEWSCYTGSGWTAIRALSGAGTYRAYEEAMWWNISFYHAQGIEALVSNVSDSLTSAGDSWIFSCLADDATANSSWMNSTATTINESTTYDFEVNSTNITFSTNNPVENEVMTLFATVYNLGNTNATNVTIQFFDGDQENGTQVNGNITRNISAGSYVTVNVSWTVTQGTHNFYALADPPYGTGSFSETAETNNIANKTLTVSIWQVYYGLMNTTVFLATSQNISLQKWWAANVTGNIYVSDTDTTNGVSFTTLQAIYRNTSNMTNANTQNDFENIDANLETTNYSDSVNATFTVSGAPAATKTINSYNKNIANISVVNSTNTSSFITGILWDTSDSSNDYYDTGEKEDLIFITEINMSKQGQYGTYDYEIKIPANLRSYKGSDASVVFYYEIN